ncbi:MAG TPA: glycosyltransferase [Candidatus Dormibacteraeota bacterium]|nr:glycosyltransferase [Candidatus Dormibacteraeota bacterium]
MSSQARILLLGDDRRGHANTVLDHIDAFTRYSRHQVRVFNPKAVKRSVALDFDDFDVVVVHYSVVLSDPIFMSQDLLRKLRTFRGLKIEFIQDDYRWVNRAAAAARDVGIGVLFTVAPEPAAGRLYDNLLPGVRRVMTLTGYVPDNLVGRTRRPLSRRPIEVGYRAREPAFWLGRLSQEKIWIGERFLERVSAYGLRCDIAWKEHDRIYGADWVDFVASCRAMIGCESGASIADFDGGAERAVRAYVRAHPGATFEEVHAAVLRPYEGNVVVDVVSPRVFEAAVLGTALIMFPGGYSGVVEPERHYIVLEKDFSNMDEVVRRLRDDDLIKAMTARTYDDLIASGRWSYASFIQEFDLVVDEEAKTRRGAFAATRWRIAKAERALKVPGLRVRALRGAQRAWNRARRQDRSMAFSIEYGSQIEKGLLAMRTLVAERDLRPLFRLGRKSGAPLDRLLREILELSLLRKAAAATRAPDQSFTVSAEYDGARKAACFVSTPVGSNGMDDRQASQEIRDAVRKGELRIIEWDHRALGGLIQLDRPPMEVGIGFEGLESFTVLAGIGRQDPQALERALAPVLRPERVTLPVG